jgi:hypothetical protein
MFGWLKKGKKGKAPAKTAVLPPPAARSDKEKLIQQAMENAKAAREAIGEETLNKVAEIIERKNHEIRLAKAREALMNMDTEHLADFLKENMRDKNKYH